MGSEVLLDWIQGLGWANWGRHRVTDCRCCNT